MPRPAPAQLAFGLAYGSGTVVCSAFAMLLLSGTQSGTGAVVIALSSFALGLLAAATGPLLHTARRTRGAGASAGSRVTARGGAVPSPAATATYPTASAPAPARAGAGAGAGTGTGGARSSAWD